MPDQSVHEASGLPDDGRDPQAGNGEAESFQSCRAQQTGTRTAPGHARFVHVQAIGKVEAHGFLG